MDSNSGKTLLALLTGMAVGASIGILFAPYEGSETREKIGEGARRATDALKKKVGDASSVLSDKVMNAKENFEEKLTNTLYAASHKADDILLAMEDKLEELRKKNNAWQQRRVTDDTELEETV